MENIAEQRSFNAKVIVWTHTHTESIAMSGPPVIDNTLTDKTPKHNGKITTRLADKKRN